ncbi:adenosine deaminase [Aquariibacter albus]|uniref:Adenosine deaminase n=1 Tax=Aquariibacter albus TaxID=2759899 RepID=A0A839HT24_9BURK|nr:adenosine deaminase [Aquariibacter albus]MBB1162828.1 adenosine deaminase [Aquariibacter albus]
MIKTIGRLALIAAAVGATGCASILNDETQLVNVSASNGRDIQGTIDGVPFKGPGPVPFKRAKGSRIVTAETEGCAKVTAVEGTVDPKFFINILSGGVFGSSTDYGTEKMWKYADNVIVSCAQ